MTCTQNIEINVGGSTHIPKNLTAYKHRASTTMMLMHHFQWWKEQLFFPFIWFFSYPAGGFYFIIHLNPLCFAVQGSNGETMVTNNLLCFNEKYVSWWETKPGINAEGTLNNGPWAGTCPKLCCSFCSLPSVPVPVWLRKILFDLKKKKTPKNHPEEMYNSIIGHLHFYSEP